MIKQNSRKNITIITHIALNQQLMTQLKWEENHLNRPYIILATQIHNAKGSKIKSKVSKITSAKCCVGTMPKAK